ncbi:MAG: hypothetical protein AAF488_17465 [Planctomycetota bacterium]
MPRNAHAPISRRRTVSRGLGVLLVIASIVAVQTFAAPAPQEPGGASTEAKPFPWETDLERAFARAEATERPLLLVFR